MNNYLIEAAITWLGVKSLHLNMNSVIYLKHNSRCKYKRLHPRLYEAGLQEARKCPELLNEFLASYEWLAGNLSEYEFSGKKENKEIKRELVQQDLRFNN